MTDSTIQQGFDPQDIEQNKVMSGLGYIIFFLPLLVKDSKFARFHANQILLLIIPSFIINMIMGLIMGMLIGGLHLGLSSVVGFILGIFNLIICVIAIINMVNAFQGKAKRIPLIGKMSILKGSNDIEVEDMIQNDTLQHFSDSLQNVSFGGEGISCPKCGTKVGKGKKFCSKCGTSVVTIKTCASCNAEIPAGKKFCAECGTPVPEEKKEELQHCVKCNAEIPSGKKFCAECGTPIMEEEKEPEKPMVCQNCGTEIAKGKKFCADCGTPVE